MKSTVFSFGILALVTVAASAVSVAQAVTVDLIPKPGKMVLRDGAYLLKAKEVTGECLKVGRDAAMPKEGYRLTVTENGISAASADDAGAFYALQTLRQLAVPAGKGVFSVPCVEITDSPQYGWRGVIKQREIREPEPDVTVAVLRGFCMLNVRRGANDGTVVKGNGVLSDFKHAVSLHVGYDLPRGVMMRGVRIGQCGFSGYQNTQVQPPFFSMWLQYSTLLAKIQVQLLKK